MRVRLRADIVAAGHKYVADLTPSREHVVLTVSTRADAPPLFRVEATTEPYHPFLVEAGLLEVVSDEIPSCWRIGFRTDLAELRLEPARWRDASFEHGFWSEFFDGNPDAIALYREVRDEIYHECGVASPQRPGWKW